MTDNFTIINISSISFKDQSISILKTLSEAIGINYTLTSIIIFLALGFTLSLMLYTLTRNPQISMFGTYITIFIGYFLNIIPMWITIPFTLLMVLNMISILTSILNNGQESQEQSIDIDKWEQLGIRIKQAYSAKFGEENKGFNEEVDNRIKVMQNIRVGFTREISRNWLKRMEDFTECKR